MTTLFKPYPTAALSGAGVRFFPIHGVEIQSQRLESLCGSNIRKVFPSVDFSN
jgi:hypothetical protein